MKNILRKLTLLLFLGILSVSGVLAQTILTMTTLSSSLCSGGHTSADPTTTSCNPQVAVVASATGISAPTPNVGNIAGLATSETSSYLFVDRELMQVKGVSSTTITVVRGVGSTSAASHISGAVVFVIPGAALGIWNGGGVPGGSAPSLPQGSCTRSSEIYLPRIQVTTGSISDCAGGQWINGDASQSTRTVNVQMQLPPIGNVAYTSAGTSTTKATNTMYCTELDVPYSKYVTGLAWLNGAATGTDKLLGALYDSTGNLLANGAVAGVTATGSSTFQKQAFTTPYYVVGPAQYFGCVQGDSGTTATLNLLVTGTEDTYLTKKFASQTFGTLAAITVPTTFTTASGGFFFLY